MPRAAVDTKIQQVSHWDGLILAAAKEALCGKIYSEDLQDSQIYDGIEVINPFA